MVVITDGTKDATVRTAPSSLDEQPEAFDTETLRGERGDNAELIHVPSDAEAVVVTVPTGQDTATGYGFDRPTA